MEHEVVHAEQLRKMHHSANPLHADSQLDHSPDHQTSQSSVNEKAGSPNEDTAVVIDQSTVEADSKDDPKKKNGGYVYYVV
jgi:hypothetical protein